MVIIVDVDDVVADMVVEWLRRYNRDYGDNLTRTDITEWDIAKFVRPECGKRIYDYLFDEDLYDNVKPIEGALDGVNDLREMGHQVLFVTAHFHAGKLCWLVREGFVKAEQEIIMSYDKSLIKADIIIDDKPATVEGFPGIGYLFSQPHNAYFNWGNRVIGWADVVERIRHITRELKSPGSKDLLDGVGPNTPTVVNENGGRQSALKYRFDLVDPLPMFVLASILHDGAAKYGSWNWRRIGLNDNLNHALSHIYAYLAGDTQDDHLGHALCRVMFALSQHLTPGESKRMKPE